MSNKGGFAYPRISRQAVPDASLPNVNPEEGHTLPGTSSLLFELTTATYLPEEIKEDINKLAVIAEKREKELGHSMTPIELDQIDKELEELPWYKRLGNWIETADQSIKNAIKGVLSGQGTRRDQRGFHN
ncbi:unnamed protein product [Allacma fusca]|uniref:Uncharacterized protein n=1 Tax=Allacma fusca TaxID=39272 RepID=A0A8J2NT59_9HEXA|nr:unnamed protein product [Allacma fusca]